MALVDELWSMIKVLEKIPGEKLEAFRDQEMCKHYDAIYKEVQSAPERLKLEQSRPGAFFASGAELLTKAKALYSLVIPAQGK